MIMLTRLNGEKFMVNDDLIEFIDETPDTMLSMTTGKKVMVAESLQTVKDQIEDCKRRIFGCNLSGGKANRPDPEGNLQTE